MGFFSDGLFKKQIKKKNRDIEDVLKDIVGLHVMCEDGVLRPVINAASPAAEHAAKNGYIVINEGDPMEPLGHWVSLLSVQCALDGLPQPNEEQRAAFKRIAQHTRTANLKKLYEAQRRGKLQFDFE